MSVPDLSDLSLEDLTATIAEATKLREALIAEKRSELQKQLAALDAISKPLPTPVVASSNRATPQPKYRSKANPQLTWAGRGTRPRWLQAELEEKSLKLEDFLIKD